MTRQVRHATTHDLPAAARTLAVAFADYPWTRWSVPADDHDRRLEDLQGLYLAHALAHGMVLVDDDVHGVLALLPPDAPRPDADVQDRVAALHGDRLAGLASVALPARSPDAWELATLGVHPSHRGAGLGSALVVAALASAGSSAPVALETSDARNVRLYERHGFVVTARTAVPRGPQVWSMERRPRG